MEYMICTCSKLLFYITENCWLIADIISGNLAAGISIALAATAAPIAPGSRVG